MSQLASSELTELLQRHVPLLKYDSQEPYFADSAAEWTDNPGNQLRSSDGTVIAASAPRSAESTLSLGFLRPSKYEDGTLVSAADRVADPGHDYVDQARALHGKPGYANRTYGHWAAGRDGRTWIAYWFFYFYNDYNLVGDLLPAGLHEGDWEMIQLRLDEAGQTPDLAVYAQHNHADAREWAQVEKVGEQPVVYPARGSHASYFDAGVFNLGIDWTGVWFDHANGKRPGPPLTLEIVKDDDPDHAWATWPGTWGGTEPKPGIERPLEDASPRGPGGHSQWRDPVKLLDIVKHPPALTATSVAALPAAPSVSVSRDGAALRIEYSSTSNDIAAVIVAINSPQEPLPPATYRESVSSPSGTIEISAGLHDDWGYDIHLSIAATDGRASASTASDLPPVK
jgi:hypothetical protein